MDETPLISVIVPIYNVEKYVRKCLDSLQNQTMMQIEVICIDDGSTDLSRKIADEYKNEEGWPIFRVIHTENRGLSAARNRGIDEARAEWLMFVDSDDWVDKDFCRIPYEAAIENKADLVIFGRNIVNEKGKIEGKSQIGPKGIINPQTAINNGRLTVWNKLYMKRLFEDIRYPEERIFEDISTTPKIVYRAIRIIQISETLYYHTSRKDSLSHSKTEKSYKDGFVSSLECYNDLNSFGYQVERFRAVLWFYTIGYLMAARTKDAVYEKAEIIAESIPNTGYGLPIKRRLMLIVWKYNRDVFEFVCILFGKKKIPNQRELSSNYHQLKILWRRLNNQIEN